MNGAEYEELAAATTGSSAAGHGRSGSITSATTSRSNGGGSVKGKERAFSPDHGPSTAQQAGHHRTTSRQLPPSLQPHSGITVPPAQPREQLTVPAARESSESQRSSLYEGLAYLVPELDTTSVPSKNASQASLVAVRNSLVSLGGGGDSMSPGKAM